MYQINCDGNIRPMLQILKIAAIRSKIDMYLLRLYYLLIIILMHHSLMNICFKTKSPDEHSFYRDSIISRFQMKIILMFSQHSCCTLVSDKCHLFLSPDKHGFYRDSIISRLQMKNILMFSQH